MPKSRSFLSSITNVSPSALASRLVDSKKNFSLSPFTFNLPAAAFGLLLLAFLSSCSFNPDTQTPGEGYVQGEWRQDTVQAQKKLVTYSLYDLKFSCDSFFVKISTISKVNYGSDTCMNSGHWAEYIKGTYSQKLDTLRLKGQFCNANGGYKDDKGCFRSGDYDEYFKVTRKTDSLIQFSSTSSVIPINARLIKRTNCVPKPL